jgi:hypothetical protein
LKGPPLTGELDRAPTAPTPRSTSPAAPAVSPPAPGRAFPRGGGIVYFCHAGEGARDPAERSARLSPLSQPIVFIIDDDPDQVALLTAHVERLRRFVTKGFTSPIRALELQARLLSFLESRTFRRIGSTRELRADPRVIPATNAAIADDAVRGRFREDLHFLLNVASIVLPPLRAIRSDIPELATHFVGRAAEYFRRRKLALLAADA